MADMEKDKEKLREQLNDVSSALEYHQLHSVEKHKLLLAEQRIRDLEAKLELEISQKLRFEVKQLPLPSSELFRKILCSKVITFKVFIYLVSGKVFSYEAFAGIDGESE